MSNVSRAKKTNEEIKSMLQELESQGPVSYESIVNAFLCSISLSLKDISLTLARLCDETEAHNAKQ